MIKSPIIVPDQKECIECHITKPKTAFWSDKNRLDGLRQKCKLCNTRITNQYRRTHRRPRTLITQHQYNELLVKQNGQCAICKTTMPAKNKRFAVDHDHITGRVRGLLCFPCNIGLGMFKDKEELLLKAVSYLRKT